MKTIVLTKEQTKSLIENLSKYEGWLYQLRADYRNGNPYIEKVYHPASDIDARVSSEIDKISDIIANLQEMLKGNA